jgi:hypothetical protein
MNDNTPAAPTNEQIEEAVRAIADTQTADGPLFKLVAHVEEMRANGKTVEFRLDPKNQRVTAVEITTHSVDLADMTEEDGEMVGPDGKPMIDFAWADEDQAAA